MPDIKTGEISITGLSDLEKKLSGFSDRIAKNILSGAIRAGAVVIQNEARKLAPVSDAAHWLGKKDSKSRIKVQPGTLKKNIKVRRAPRGKATQAVEYWVYVSRKYWYWRFVEFGTSKMSSKPFMRPAFDAMKSAALERIRDYLAARIEKEATKI